MSTPSATATASSHGAGTLIEQRLTELEVRLAFLDDAMSALNATVASQDRTLNRVAAAIGALRGDLLTLQAAHVDAASEPPPPHY